MLIFIFSCSNDSDNSTANPFMGEWTGSYEEVISQSPGLDVGTIRESNYFNVIHLLSKNESIYTKSKGTVLNFRQNKNDRLIKEVFLN